MKSNTIALTRSQDSTSTYRWIDQFAKRILLSKFSEITHGRITLKEGHNEYVFGQNDTDFTAHATVIVHEASFYSDIIFGGTVGSGEAYMARSWDCHELTDLVRIILRNEHVLNSIDGGFGKMMLPLHKAFHFLHRNSLSGSRKNIGAHYDLGNDMFEQFLDPTMMYSSGIFEHQDMTMEQASIAKLDRICQKLQLDENDHVLEIGTGWGGFAIYAARNYGCKVTTTTISQQQFDYAEQRIKDEGLEDRITLLCEDYRNLTGQYDKLVSIEMIEAVGHAYYKNYFQHCSDLLKPEGMMLLQSITIADQRYQAASKEVDFIQRYIFPGGSLPSVSVIAKNVSDHTDMRFYQLEDIGAHYATTLAKWRERFFSNIEIIQKLGYSETFVRMWDFYLCYCEGGFRENSIGTIQVLLTKPLCRREPVLNFKNNNV
jgi:cyclopropane-fatty-acyl-phospholipid synthase